MNAYILIDAGARWDLRVTLLFNLTKKKKDNNIACVQIITHG